MYNAIGLPTPRGSGTNGFVQRNWASLPKVKDKKQQAENNEKSLSLRKPNTEILDHEKKRKIEIKCIEYEEMLEDQGYSQSEIIKKVNAFRRNLTGVNDTPVDDHGRPIVKETHEIAEAQQKKNDKLREAFGISKNFVEGSSLDPNRKLKRAVAEEQKKRYEWLKSPSSENHASKTSHKKHSSEIELDEEEAEEKRSDVTKKKKKKKKKLKEKRPSSSEEEEGEIVEKPKSKKKTSKHADKRKLSESADDSEQEHKIKKKKKKLKPDKIKKTLLSPEDNEIVKRLKKLLKILEPELVLNNKHKSSNRNKSSYENYNDGDVKQQSGRRRESHDRVAGTAGVNNHRLQSFDIDSDDSRGRHNEKRNDRNHRRDRFSSYNSSAKHMKTKETRTMKDVSNHRSYSPLSYDRRRSKSDDINDDSRKSKQTRGRGERFPEDRSFERQRINKGRQLSEDSSESRNVSSRKRNKNFEGNNHSGKSKRSVSRSPSPSRRTEFKYPSRDKLSSTVFIAERKLKENRPTRRRDRKALSPDYQSGHEFNSDDEWRTNRLRSKVVISKQKIVEYDRSNSNSGVNDSDSSSSGSNSSDGSSSNSSLSNRSSSSNSGRSRASDNHQYAKKEPKSNARNRQKEFDSEGEFRTKDKTVYNFGNVRYGRSNESGRNVEKKKIPNVNDEDHARQRIDEIIESSLKKKIDKMKFPPDKKRYKRQKRRSRSCSVSDSNNKSTDRISLKSKAVPKIYSKKSLPSAASSSSSSSHSSTDDDEQDEKVKFAVSPKFRATETANSKDNKVKPSLLTKSDKLNRRINTIEKGTSMSPTRMKDADENSSNIHNQNATTADKSTMQITDSKDEVQFGSAVVKNEELEKSQNELVLVDERKPSPKDRDEDNSDISYSPLEQYPERYRDILTGSLDKKDADDENSNTVLSPSNKPDMKKLDAKISFEITKKYPEIPRPCSFLLSAKKSSIASKSSRQQRNRSTTGEGKAGDSQSKRRMTARGKWLSPFESDENTSVKNGKGNLSPIDHDVLSSPRVKGGRIRKRKLSNSSYDGSSTDSSSSSSFGRSFSSTKSFSSSSRSSRARSLSSRSTKSSKRRTTRYSSYSSNRRGSRSSSTSRSSRRSIGRRSKSASYRSKSSYRSKDGSRYGRSSLSRSSSRWRSRSRSYRKRSRSGSSSGSSGRRYKKRLSCSSSYSRSKSSSSSSSSSSSHSIPRRRGSPSFLDRRRITSARKRPVPYVRTRTYHEPESISSRMLLTTRKPIPFLVSRQRSPSVTSSSTSGSRDHFSSERKSRARYSDDRSTSDSCSSQTRKFHRSRSNSSHRSLADRLSSEKKTNDPNEFDTGDDKEIPHCQAPSSSNNIGSPNIAVHQQSSQRRSSSNECSAADLDSKDSIATVERRTSCTTPYSTDDSDRMELASSLSPSPPPVTFYATGYWM